jgi:ABC-2 type transport system permease protein
VRRRAPVTPSEIMLSKVWSMGLVVLAATAFSLAFVIRGIAARADCGLGAAVPHPGGPAPVLHDVHGHFSRDDRPDDAAVWRARHPDSVSDADTLGGFTPREGMPGFVANLMLAAPTTYFVSASQAILYRGAGIEVVWPQFLAIIAIGIVFFGIALTRFRKTISQMA